MAPLPGAGLDASGGGGDPPGSGDGPPRGGGAPDLPEEEEEEEEEEDDLDLRLLLSTPPEKEVYRNVTYKNTKAIPLFFGRPPTPKTKTCRSYQGVQELREAGVPR